MCTAPSSPNNTSSSSLNVSQLDPRIALFLKRHFSVPWQNECSQYQSSSSSSNSLNVNTTEADKERAAKRFEKLALTRRTPQALYQADEYWQACELDYCTLQQELTDNSSQNNSTDKLWNHSPSLQQLRAKVATTTAQQQQQQHLFQPSEFVILQSLGKGGWGNVYQAIHLPTQHVVALKEIDQESSSVETKDHRTLPLDCGVVPCYGTFLAASLTSQTLKTWMILKYCSGGSLGELLAKNGALSPKEAAHILKRVTKTVTYLYTHHGIVHNDIKATNVVFDDHGSILVCDLGVARKGLWQTKRMAGTYSHMAPEKLTARKLNSGRYLNDEKIDVWALGVLLCEMLFLAHPYKFEQLSNCPTVGPTALSGSNHPEETTTTTNTHMIMDLMESTFGTLQLPRFMDKWPAHQRRLVQDLLQQMLNIDFLERISLTGIKKHAWIKQNNASWADRAFSRVKRGFQKRVQPEPTIKLVAEDLDPPSLTQETYSTLNGTSRRRRLSGDLDQAPQNPQEILHADC